MNKTASDALMLGAGFVVGAVVFGSAIAVGHAGSPSKAPTPSVGTSTQDAPVQRYSSPSSAAPATPHVDGYSAHSIPGALIGVGSDSINPFDIPCKDESDNGCYWDASTMGNGVGQSYVVTSDGQVYYLDKEMSN